MMISNMTDYQQQFHKPLKQINIRESIMKPRRKSYDDFDDYSVLSAIARQKNRKKELQSSAASCPLPDSSRPTKKYFDDEIEAIELVTVVNPFHDKKNMQPLTNFSNSARGLSWIHNVCVYTPGFFRPNIEPEINHRCRRKEKGREFPYHGKDKFSNGRDQLGCLLQSVNYKEVCCPWLLIVGSRDRKVYFELTAFTPSSATTLNILRREDLSSCLRAIIRDHFKRNETVPLELDLCVYDKNGQKFHQDRVVGDKILKRVSQALRRACIEAFLRKVLSTNLRKVGHGDFGCSLRLEYTIRTPIHPTKHVFPERKSTLITIAQSISNKEFKL